MLTYHHASLVRSIALVAFCLASLTSCKTDGFGALNGDDSSLTACTPTVTRVESTTVPQSGQDIEIDGICFKQGMEVYIGGKHAVGNVTSSSVWKGAAPASNAYGGVTLVVVNPDNRSSTLPGGVIYQGPPQISSLSPASGPISGGNAISILGAGFLAGATVKFGASSPVALSVINPAQATVLVPAGTAGTANITVYNPDGQYATSTAAYRYQAAPLVTAVSPASGPATGGTAVTVYGQGFLSGAQVLFGGTNASNVAVTANGLQLTATTPPVAPGAVDIKVINSDGQQGSLPNSFTFTGSGAAPTISSVSPTSGPTTGGQTLVITGIGFQTGATVSIGGTTAAVTSVSATTISAITGAKTGAGTYSVVVTNPDNQTASLGNGYSYNDPPILSSVSPSGGPLAGGNTVTLTGSNFATGAQIRIGGNLCSPVLGNSSTATCPAPAGSAGLKTVSITNPDGTSSSLTSAYSYNPAPTVTGISPNSGKLASGTMATVTGTNFQSGASVSVGGSAAGVLGTSATSIFVSLPAGTAGSRDVVVTNPDSQSATLSNGYTFQAAPNPTSISPSTGATGGGTAITITGTGFVNGATVSIGSAAVSSLNFVSATTLTGFTTSSTSGAKNIVVTNPDNQTGTLVNGYTYASGPTISSAAPAAGALAGNTLVTVTGANFTSPMTVSINGNAGTSVTVSSATSLTFRTPANSAGTYSIVVNDSFSQSATLPNAFSYNAGPTVTSITPGAGPLAGLTDVTIAGTGFNPSATVAIGGVSLTNLSVGSTSITGKTAANSAGTYSAVVTNPDGQSGSGGTFAYRPAPTLTSISPTSGTNNGGTTVTLTGTGFFSGMTVSIGGVTCTSPSVGSATSATCVTGFSSAGAKDVVVTNNPDAQTATGVGMFTYRAAPVPVSVNPAAGFIGGENSITISGTGFSAGATVSIGSNACTSVNVASSTSITCVTPAAASTGTVSITVTNTDTQAGVLSSSFTYQNDNYSKVDQYLGNVSPNGYQDGTGAGVRFSGPAAVATDGAGNVYVAETANCVIRKVTAGGVATTFVGTPLSCTLTDGSGTSARFRSPTSITIDAGANNLYVGEWGAIRKVSLTAPYTVTTLAGSGSAQGTTDGTGTAARFQSPQGLTLDGSGTNLYIADTYNHSIRQLVLSTTAVTTVAGLGGTAGSTNNVTGTSARFNRPWGIVWTTGGNLYVNDNQNHVMRQITASGAFPVTTVLGTAGSNGSTDSTGTAARMYTPQGMIWDGSTTVWVGDGGGSSIRAVDITSYSVVTYFGIYNSVGSSDDVYNSARFNNPYGLTMDSNYIYVGDYSNHALRRARISTGEVDTLAGVPNSYGYTDGSASVAKLWTPRGLSVLNGMLYIAENGSCLVRKVDLSTVSVSTLAGQAGTCAGSDGTGTFSARFNRLNAMATNGTNLFVADTNAHTMRRITVSNGSVNTLAGSSGSSGNATGTGTTARFNTPLGIAVVGTDIYFADTSNHVIRKIQSTTSSTNGGVVTVFAGTPATAGWVDGAGTSARFNNPYNITAVGGNLYVTDYTNCLIRQIVIATGNVSTLAGTQGSCSYADGTGSLARFNNPYGISNDGTNLYVADYSNHAVRKVTLPSGAVTTLFGDPTSAYDNVGGTLNTSNMRNPTGVVWSVYGLFIANDYGIKRVH